METVDIKSHVGMLSIDLFKAPVPSKARYKLMIGPLGYPWAPCRANSNDHLEGTGSKLMTFRRSSVIPSGNSRYQLSKNLD